MESSRVPLAHSPLRKVQRWPLPSHASFFRHHRRIFTDEVEFPKRDTPIPVGRENQVTTSFSKISPPKTTVEVDLRTPSLLHQ